MQDSVSCSGTPSERPSRMTRIASAPRRLPFDDRQCLERRLRSLPGHRPARLRLHRDRRDVVGDHVVQLRARPTRSWLRIWSERPAPALGAVAERRSARRRRRHDAEPAGVMWTGRCGLGDRTDYRGDQHHRQPDHDLAARAQRTSA